jgi:hypothetical protein
MPIDACCSQKPKGARATSAVAWTDSQRSDSSKYRVVALVPPGSIGRSNALFTRWFDMHLSSSSAAGVRFLTSVREGRGLNRSAREAGIGKETGYRWLCEAYVAHRRGGKSIAEREAVMRLASARSIAWEAEAGGPGRHHLGVTSDIGIWRSHRRGLGRSPRPGGVRRPAGPLAWWVVDLEVAPFVGFKIMIWYTLGTQDVRKRSTLPTVEGTKSPNGPTRACRCVNGCGRAQAIVRPGEDCRRLNSA